MENETDIMNKIKQLNESQSFNSLQERINIVNADIKDLEAREDYIIKQARTIERKEKPLKSRLLSDEPLYRLSQVCRMLLMSPQTLKKYTASGDIKIVTNGNKIYYTEESIFEFRNKMQERFERKLAMKEKKITDGARDIIKEIKK